MALSQQTVVGRLVADRSKLLAYIWSIVRNYHAAEDVYQEVVIAAMSHADEMEDEMHLLMWGAGPDGSEESTGCAGRNGKPCCWTTACSIFWKGSGSGWMPSSRKCGSPPCNVAPGS